MILVVVRYVHPTRRNISAIVTQTFLYAITTDLDISESFFPTILNQDFKSFSMSTFYDNFDKKIGYV